MQEPGEGQTLDGRYVLRTRLGDGGTAAVFLADDLELGRTVAIKLYGDETELSDASRRRTEARALATLRHPAIVTLHDARLDAAPPYLVLEYVDGETLAQRIARGPLPEAETRAIGAAAASGLAAAHGAGIVHRDIKPANIVIPADPSHAEARVLDFGIAQSTGGSRATTAGSVLGSAAYLSPEQALGEAVTPASDVYSLGLVLIECLTGRPAFGGTPEEALGTRLVAPPQLDDPALAGSAALLSRMTAREPADRPTAAAVAAELAAPAPTRVLPASTDDATVRMPAAATSAPARRRAPRLGLLLGTVGGVLTAGIVIAAVLAGLPGPVPLPTDSPPVDEVVSTPDPVEPTPTPDDAPGNSGDNGNGKPDKPDKP